MQQTTHATYSYLPIYIGYLILIAPKSLVQAIPQEWLKKFGTPMCQRPEKGREKSGNRYCAPRRRFARVF